MARSSRFNDILVIGGASVAFFAGAAIASGVGVPYPMVGGLLAAAVAVWALS